MTYEIPEDIQALGEPEEIDRTELIELGEKYALLDKQEKTLKVQKEEAKGALLEAMSRIAQVECVPEITSAYARNEDLERFGFDPRLWAQYYFPTFVVTNFIADEGGMAISLEENLLLRKYEFDAGDFHVGRTLRMEGASFDVEGFQEAIADPDLVSDDAYRAAAAAIIEREIITYDIDEDALMAASSEFPILSKLISQFTSPGKPKIAMLPVSAVKDPDV